MSDVTQPLRDEHQELLPHIERLRGLADSIGDSPRATLQHDVDLAYEFLTHHLIPHAQAEEEVLYPAVGKILGTPQATATMSRDHVEVSRLTEQLRRLRSQFSGTNFTADQITDLRRVLYGLYTLVKVHFAKEEELYLPLLDAHFSEAEAHQLLHKMADVAHGEQNLSGR